MVTGVAIVTELSFGFGSVSVALALAVLLNCAVDCGTQMMLTVAELPFARAPRLQVTVVVPLQAPCVGVAETKLTPAGNGSVTVTLVAGEGPVLVTIIL